MLYLIDKKSILFLNLPGRGTCIQMTIIEAGQSHFYSRIVLY